MHVAGIHREQANRRVEWELTAQVLQLYLQHIDDIELAAPINDLFAQAVRQISIDARHLQGASRQTLSQLGEGGIAQARIISPQNEIDEPRTFEQFDRFR